MEAGATTEEKSSDEEDVSITHLTPASDPEFSMGDIFDNMLKDNEKEKQEEGSEHGNCDEFGISAAITECVCSTISLMPYHGISALEWIEPQFTGSRKMRTRWREPRIRRRDIRRRMDS